NTANKFHESPLTPASIVSVQAQENKHYEQPRDTVSINVTFRDQQQQSVVVSTVGRHVALFHQQSLQTYGTSTNRASNARKTIARPNYKEIVHPSSSARSKCLQH
uniref:Uncharacterized protein n=1 Tax=Oryza punctata TaxID=4537 RepID=A0A0E0MEY7_ORYPU